MFCEDGFVAKGEFILRVVGGICVNGLFPEYRGCLPKALFLSLISHFAKFGGRMKRESHDPISCADTINIVQPLQTVKRKI